MHTGLSVPREDAERLTPTYGPRRTLGSAVGAVALAAILIVAGEVGRRSVGQPVGPTLFAEGFGLVVLLAAASLVGYWLYGCLNLAYIVEPGRLVIRWAGERHVIAAGRIDRIVSGDAIAIRRPDGPDWPGYHVGTTVVPELGPVLLFSTHRHPAEVTYVVTPVVTYALSVERTWLDRALGSGLGLGGRVAEHERALPPTAGQDGQAENDGSAAAAVAEPAVVVHRWRLLDLDLWADAPALALLGLGFALNLLLFNLVLTAYPSLPPFLPVHFAPNGEVDRIGFREEILRLPLMALAVWAGNGALAALLHRGERLAALLLLGAGLGFQILFLVAAAKIAG